MGATHVVLIRGINVGGNNKVPMAALRSDLGAAGLEDVRTYIQSGNVLVSAPGREPLEVNGLVGDVLRASFGVDTPVVTITAETLRVTVDDAPDGFGASDDYRWDVVFLRETLTVADAYAVVRLRDGVDAVWQGRDVLYFRRSEAQAGKSYLSKIMSTPEYKQMTIRNWRTTTTLAGMLEG
ncbi:DUF1697 domain-containing protein [Demequina sp. NBRC 110054]|uniref:DUF1697 domain-containing protein n=1 Tax=Demequina sp. NBRC 110054 TaxID=1570343 RepID=UPI000A01A75C|nr:DUF1697 domain-containing protein [Demequina sp. NBRC 110054]